jgi:hypothetical protein
MIHRICILQPTSRININKPNGKTASIVTERAKIASNEQNIIPAKIRLTSDLLKPKHTCTSPIQPLVRNTKKINVRKALDVIKFTDYSHKQISSTLNSPKEIKVKTKPKKLKLSIPIANKVKALIQRKKLLLNVKSESHSKQASLNTSIDNIFKERKASIGSMQSNVMFI